MCQTHKIAPIEQTAACVTLRLTWSHADSSQFAADTITALNHGARERRSQRRLIDNPRLLRPGFFSASFFFCAGIYSRTERTAIVLAGVSAIDPDRLQYRGPITNAVKRTAETSRGQISSKHAARTSFQQKRRADKFPAKTPRGQVSASNSVVRSDRRCSTLSMYHTSTPIPV